MSAILTTGEDTKELGGNCVFSITWYSGIIKRIRVIRSTDLENNETPEARARYAATRDEIPGPACACGRG